VLPVIPFDKIAAGVTESTLVHYQHIVDGVYECRAAIVANPLRDDDFSDGAVDLAVFDRPTRPKRTVPNIDRRRNYRTTVLVLAQFEVPYHDPFLGREAASRREGTWHWPEKG
jgi:hypothetical protein